RANQHATANASPFARNIQHEVHAVIEIDIHMAMPQKKRMISLRFAAKMMASGIARRIAFGFHDPSTEAPFRQIMDNDLADDKSGQLQRIGRKLFTSEAAKFERRPSHGLRRTKIGRFVVKQTG